MTTYVLCDCSDPGCPCCGGDCDQESTITLYRTDMPDEYGVAFCDCCASDALNCGLFMEQPPDEREEG